MSEKKAIVVVGMMRSGTSILMKLLQQAGVFIGDAQRSANSELPGSVSINTAIMQAFGVNYFDGSKPMPMRWDTDERVSGWVNHVKKILDKKIGNQQLWGHKEPRVCLTFPVWEKAIEERGDKICPILAIRNPLDVAVSLKTKHGMKRRDSMIMWEMVVQDAVDNLRHYEYPIVYYPDLLNNPVGIVKECFKFYDIPYNDRFTQRIAKHVRPVLCRSGRSTLDDLKTKKVRPSVVRLFNEIYPERIRGI